MRDKFLGGNCGAGVGVAMTVAGSKAGGASI